MTCHERIRITNETKKGSRIRKRRIDLYRPPWKAIQYATGRVTTPRRVARASAAGLWPAAGEGK
jgi:hypothetical protein